MHRPGQRPGRGNPRHGETRSLEPVQLGEVTVETQAGHRVATFQVDQFVLRAADAGADRIGEFALAVFAAVDGRPAVALDGRSRLGKPASTGRKRSAAKGASRSKGATKAKGSAGAATPAASG